MPKWWTKGVCDLMRKRKWTPISSFEERNLIIEYEKCPSDEIGRRARLKIWCWQQRAGSTPALGIFICNKTNFESNLAGSYLSQNLTFSQLLLGTVALGIFYLQQNKFPPQTFPFSVVIKITTTRGRNENIKITSGSKK